MRRFVIILLTICLALPLSLKGKTYEELFKKQDACTGTSYKLHLVGQKVYMELPDSLLGRSFLMGSVVERTSDPLESYRGYVPARSREVVFSVADSNMFMMYPSHGSISSDANSSIAITSSSRPAVVESFKIVGRQGGSTCFEISKLFTSKSEFNDALSPVAFNASEGYVKRTPTFQNASSVIKCIDSDSTCVSVVGSNTVKVKSALLGVFSSGEQTFLTTELRYSFTLLPIKVGIMPVKADLRAGYDYYDRLLFNPDGKGTSKEYLTSRRDISKTVTYCIDEDFPPMWKSAIKEAIDNWNEALQKAGIDFTLDYRIGDDGPDRIIYCISPVQKVFDSKQVDPRSGQIISSSIYVNHGVQELIQKMLILQTGKVCEKSRRINIDEELMKKGICSLICRYIGHTIGLRDNLIGSWAYSSKDISSAEFTQSNGLSASIMDRLPFNYITDDPEALLIQTKPSTADIFALQCLYLYDYETVVQKLKYAADNPSLAFKPMQSAKAFYDPRAEYGDLGNDVMYSMSKGLEHLEYAYRNINEWVKGEDTDYCYRSYLYNYMLEQLHDYIRHGFEYIGGMYVRRPHSDISGANVVPVPSSRQKELMHFLLRTVDSLSWLDNDDVVHKVQLEGPFNKFAQKYFTNFVFIQLSALARSADLEGDIYSQIEAARDIMEYYWREPLRTSDELVRYQRQIFIEQVHTLATSSKHPHTWYSLLKEVRKVVKKSGDDYLLHLVDQRINSI